MSEMEEPDDNDDNTNTNTNRSAEPSASVEPKFLTASRVGETSTDAGLSLTFESSHSLKVPCALYETASPTLEYPTDNMDIDNGSSNPPDSMYKPENAISPPDIRTTLSSELSELDSEN
jgi:hypothetical protein